MSRVHMGHERGEIAPNTWGDFEWARSQHKELLAQYGTCVALIYQHKVIGTSATYEEALKNAEANLAPEISDATPILYLINHRHWLYRVRTATG
ncbi:MAG: hypothetical protein H0X30_02200 [Anaerolineae bacterium]|nr:hypothetical protein [Anaerolineae bacterium]